MQKQKGISTLVGIIIIVVVAVILFGGVFAYQYFTKSQIPSSNVQSNYNAQNLNNQPAVSNSNIDRNLISDWLNKYESSDVVGSERISDYKINSITIAKTESNCFGFNANFSVKTYLSSNNSWWLAGNGTVGSGNWINNKSLAINALEQNGVYKIIGAGTAFGLGSCSIPDASFTGEPDQNQTNQTAGWKTYSDNYGFQMNYPSDVNVMVTPTSRIVSCDVSTAMNSCPKGISPGYPDKTENQTINGMNYCFYLGDDCGAGSCTTYYSYLTAKNNTCYVLDITTGRITNDCSVYGSASDAQKCQTQKNANQALINQAISTIKFTK